MSVAKKAHLNIWQYGDITADDAREFGSGKQAGQGLPQNQEYRMSKMSCPFNILQVNYENWTRHMDIVYTKLIKLKCIL